MKKFVTLKAIVFVQKVYYSTYKIERTLEEQERIRKVFSDTLTKEHSQIYQIQIMEVESEDD